MRRLALLWVVALAGVALADQLATVERQKIDYLISAIETLDDAEFIRNGKAYDAKAAADHLRLKLKKAETRIKSAEDFIRYCASASSVSGTPYQIRFSDGRVTSSAEYLQQKLAEFDKQ
jgi:Family of unknown function (DUF5329)